jgi:hypothetical protein
LGFLQQFKLIVVGCFLFHSNLRLYNIKTFFQLISVIENFQHTELLLVTQHYGYIFHVALLCCNSVKKRARGVHLIVGIGWSKSPGEKSGLLCVRWSSHTASCSNGKRISAPNANVSTRSLSAPLEGKTTAAALVAAAAAIYSAAHSHT